MRRLAGSRLCNHCCPWVFQRSGYLPFQLKKDPSISDSTSYAEKLHSGKYLMPPYYTKDERNLIFAAFVLGSIGELALLFCSIFSTALYHRVHIAMVSVFVVFMFLSTCCLIAEYFLMGRHYASVHPLASPHFNPQSSEKALTKIITLWMSCLGINGKAMYGINLPSVQL